MKKRLVLGADFGRIELSTMLSEAFGDGIEVTLIDKNDSLRGMLFSGISNSCEGQKDRSSA